MGGGGKKIKNAIQMNKETELHLGLVFQLIRTAVLVSGSNTMAMVEYIVWVPGSLDPEQLSVVGTPVTIAKVDILTAWCV